MVVLLYDTTWSGRPCLVGLGLYVLFRLVEKSYCFLYDTAWSGRVW